MKTVAIIQARLGSTRFPRKVLEDIAGRPMIAHVLERVMACRSVEAIVVACPRRDAEEINAELPRYGPGDVPSYVTRYDGDERDVLGRTWASAEEYPADGYLRVTSDCPLLAPDICERIVAHRGRTDYACNMASGYVDGTDCEWVSHHALARAFACATDPRDREHVTTWIRRHYPIVVSPPRGQYGAHKWSVDTPDDLERVRRIMRHVKGLNFADTLAAAVEAGL